MGAAEVHACGIDVAGAEEVDAWESFTALAVHDRRPSVAARQRSSGEGGATEGQHAPPRRPEADEPRKTVTEPICLGSSRVVWCLGRLLIPRSKVRILHGPM